jgi:hypothetical protein
MAAMKAAVLLWAMPSPTAPYVTTLFDAVGLVGVGGSGVSPAL